MRGLNLGKMVIMAGIAAGFGVGAVPSTAQTATAQPPVSQAAVSQAAQTPRLTIEELRRKYADSASKYADIDGLQVHYKDEGKGPVLLMVHGSESSLRTYDRIAARLKGKYRIIRFDIPGYGLSGRISDEAAATVQPTDIPAKLLARLGVQNASCVGVSSGGTMCMYLAARHPALVNRLILSNMPSDPVKTDHLVQPESFLKAQERAKQTGFRDLDFWNEFLSYFAGDPARISAKTRAEYYDFNRRTPEKHPIAMIARIGDGKEAKILMHAVKTPTLIIWGGRDHLLPVFAADNLANYLPNAQISKLIMPDVGHYPPLESPDHFAELIRIYVEDVVPQP